MNVAIRYFSRKGNTKHLADVISAEVGVNAYTVQTPIEEPCDILFLCDSLYKGTVDKNVKEFIQQLDPHLVKTVINVSTSASGKSTDAAVQKLLEAKGMELNPQSFYCPGSFLFFHLRRPNENDLENCRQFVGNVIDQYL